MDEELLKLKGDKKIPTSILIKRTLKYVKTEKKSFILALCFVVINVMLDVISPIFMQLSTDELVKPDLNLTFLITLAVLMAVIGLINEVFMYFEAMILQNCGQKIIYRLRMEVFEHIEKMSLNQFGEMPTGSLVTRVASYTASMSDLFTKVLISLLKNFTTVVGVYCVMFFVSAKLALVMFAVVVVVFVCSYAFSKIVNVCFRVERGTISEMNAFLSENLSGMKLTQIFNQEEEKDEEFCTVNNKLYKAVMNIILCFAVYRPLISFIYVISVIISFYFGLQFGLSPGKIVAFYLYLSKFFNPIQNIANELNDLQKAITASERLFNLLDVQPDVLDKEDALEIEKFKGEIEFKNVWFAYNPGEWILKDVSFKIKPKETCAFVGATGSGKTTILNLIVRNYEIQKGEILIDGININNIKLDCLRKAIGQMLQDVFVFSGTIQSNISLRDERFSEQDVNEACEYVNADRFIKKLKNGINEEIIEKGENFSQGERQLLSFARTVIHKPQILILDEATANIDTETELLIQQSLEKMKNIGTMLVVAHRLSTIQHADQIIVLQDGKIIERGNHQSLLKDKGYYYRLYSLQFENK